jgi:hypothetical protein
MRSLILILLLLAPAAATGQPPAVTEVPRTPPPKWAELKAQPGKMVRLTAGEKPATWVLVDDAADLDAPSGAKVATFVAAQPGRYRVVAFTEGEPARVVVVVGDAPPDEKPKPPPDPKPKPPEDPLRAKLRAAFDADPGDASAKESARRDLVALYQQAAKLALDQTVTTTGELAARVKAAGQILAPGQLAGLRRAVGTEVGAVFPTDAALTGESRQQAAALYKKSAAALDW